MYAVILACAFAVLLVAMGAIALVLGRQDPGVDPAPSPNAPDAPAARDAPAAPGGWLWKESDLPKPSSNDNTCKTYMSDPTDDGTCFALAYHHCIDGRTNKSGVPSAVAKNMGSAMKQVYDVPCTHETAAGKKYKCMSKPPKTWSSVCVARPDLAGKGKCKAVSKNEWRMWVQADDASRTSDCHYSTLYVKSHFVGDKIQDKYVGRHGRG